MRVLFSFLSFLFFCGALFANSAQEKAIIESALRSTQSMLTDPAQRQAEINKTPEGRAAAERLEKLGGTPEVNEQIYYLAADVFQNIVFETGGDVQKMKAILERAQKNPEEFARKLSETQKIKLKSISKSISLN